jgi:hypothetical protein
MKSKKVNYLLGLLVLIIWGAIIYRVVAAVSDDHEPLPAPETRIREAYDDHALSKDTAHLRAGYRDPFGLAKLRDSAAIPVKKLIAPSLVRPVVQPGINWSMISYRGYIRNPGSRKLIAILTVNGKSVMLAEGESSGPVKLLRNLRDSIQINYQGHHKFITISPATL